MSTPLYSVVVQTVDAKKFEPYRGYDGSTANRAFDLAVRGSQTANVVLWRLDGVEGKPMRRFPDK